MAYIDKITNKDTGESRPISPAADKVRVDNENYEGTDLDEVLDEIAEAIEEAGGEGGYTPPQGGIPKTDLAPAVQTSLDKADTAVQDPNYVHTSNDYTTADKTKLAGIAAGAEVNVQSDWNASSGDAAILNKPTILTEQQVQGMIEDAAIEAVVGSGDFVITYDAASHIYDLIILVPTLAVTSLGAMSEDTKSGTFKVSGTNLKGDVTIATTATNWSLSVNGGTASQSITLQQTDGVLAETTITVAYSGSTDSTGNTITVSSTGAESKTVTASYTEHAGPTITTSNNPISISEVGGYTNTATLQVTGTLLTGNITAALSSGSKFSLSKNTFVPSSGEVNETLTISYSPAAGDSGTQTDTLTLSSDGATSVTIQLTGTVLTQSLTLTPSSLTLESEAGTAVSGTIKVEGSNVKGDVTVGVPSGFTATLNGSSVNTLTAAQVNATNGVTLTIGNAGTTASGNLTFSVGGTQLASAPLAWEETVVEVEEVGKTVTRAIAGTNYDLVYKITNINGVDGSTTNEVMLVNQYGNEPSWSSDGPTPNYNYPGATLEIPSSITINEHQYTVTKIGVQALSRTTATRLIIPDSVTTVANSYNLCEGSSLEYIKFGDGVATLGTYLCGNEVTTALTEVDFGSTLYSFTTQFVDWSTNKALMTPALTTLIIRNSSRVAYITSPFKKVLDAILSNGGHIYVPSSLLSNYKSSTDWSAYESIIEAIPND